MPWHQFSTREFVNMVYYYGMAYSNASEALRIYGTEYLNAHQPRDPRVITRAVQRVLPVSETGRGSIRPNAEQAILDVMEENPRLGVRTAAKVLRRRRGHQNTLYRTHVCLEVEGRQFEPQHN